MTPPFGETGYVSWVTGHKLSAALSMRGTERMVELSRHNIQVDHPDAVIAAVTDVLDAIDGSVPVKTAERTAGSK